jgi:hypothetical protein
VVLKRLEADRDQADAEAAPGATKVLVVVEVRVLTPVEVAAARETAVKPDDGGGEGGSDDRERVSACGRSMGISSAPGPEF